MSIKFKNVSYQYGAGTPFAHDALRNINLSIEPGKITAIIGATGSGKSTLVQHLNALIQPTEGVIDIFGHVIEAKVKPRSLKQLRSKVGLVFQFPEMQLFEETILKDVAFGPTNFGFSEEEINESAQTALKLVGIDESLWDRSPLGLSGGQKRRVAIAGVLAAKPDVIVLDEPTAGLDPQGSKDMMDLFVNLNQSYDKTIVMVTHDMDHVLNYAENVIVMDHGSVVFDGTSKDLFTDTTLLSSLGFVTPKILDLKAQLKEAGFDISDTLDLDEIAAQIKAVLA